VTVLLICHRLALFVAARADVFDTPVPAEVAVLPLALFVAAWGSGLAARSLGAPAAWRVTATPLLLYVLAILAGRVAGWFSGSWEMLGIAGSGSVLPWPIVLPLSGSLAGSLLFFADAPTTETAGEPSLVRWLGAIAAVLLAVAVFGATVFCQATLEVRLSEVCLRSARPILRHGAPLSKAAIADTRGRISSPENDAAATADSRP